MVWRLVSKSVLIAHNVTNFKEQMLKTLHFHSMERGDAALGDRASFMHPSSERFNAP